MPAPKHISKTLLPFRLNRLAVAGLLMSITLGMIGCADIFGEKEDATTEQIFTEGRIDPSQLKDVGYVPLSPFFVNGFGGPLSNPVDVFVGFDEFIYVVDDAGLHVLDLAGRPQALVPLEDATSVAQDRRLHVYVTAKRDTTLNGRTWHLPVIYRYSGLSTGMPKLEHIIWHPFDDDSRRFNRRDPISTDEQVQFTGVATLQDNRIYVSRRGPVNATNTTVLPHNALMEFNPDGVNTQTIVALNPNIPSLRSAIDPSDVLGYFQPPQRIDPTPDDRFLLSQAPLDGRELRFSVVAIKSVVTSNGIEYRPDTRFLNSVGDPDRGDGWLFEEFKFAKPVDMAMAGDGTNYIFVLDAAKDSLFVFTGDGVEGVAPAPGSGRTKPVVVSFGGMGGGALQFDNPQGVAYAEKIVYVADTGNNRISRFKLNTDFE
jgi:hypothetical protein